MSQPDVPPVKRARFDRDSATAIGPKYVNVNAFWQDMVDAASDYNSTYETAEGERFQNELALIVPATMATQGLPIMIPANRQNEDEELNADWGATSNFVFALIDEKPNSEKTRMTVVAYLHEPEKVNLEAGVQIVVRTPSNFLTPAGINEIAMGEAVAKLALPALSKLFESRPKTAAKNPSETGNSDSSEKMKQIGQYGIADLDGTLRPCSGKSEGVKRMNKIGGMIRLLGWERFSKLVLDLTYSPKYFMANCQRYEESAADLPSDSPFKSFGKLSHISDLPVMENKSKLECVLLGIYPQYDRTTISLNDYLRHASSKSVWKKESSRQGRVLFIEALRNIEQVFTVFYGAHYRGCCAEIITAFEDDEAIFQNFDDLYVHVQLEMLLSKFYADIHYEKRPIVFDTMTMETTEKCAILFQHHLSVGLDQARGISLTGNWERQPHSNFYSNEGTYRKIIIAPAVLPSAQKKEASAEPISLCPYHIAGQLGVLSVSGSAIKCISERCKNKHEKIDKLTRNEVTRAIKSITVKRIRELSEAAVAKHYKN